MQLLPDRESRASAESVDILEYRTSEDCGWTFREWRLKAVGIRSGVTLESWWSRADAPEPVIGRIRVKRCGPDVETDLGDLAPLIEGMVTRPGLTEILNVELEPVFVGQGLGVTLMRAALADVPADDIVVCEPTPTEYLNISLETSTRAVTSFYRRVGFTPNDRVPGYLTASRADLIL